MVVVAVLLSTPPVSCESWTTGEMVRGKVLLLVEENVMDWRKRSGTQRAHCGQCQDAAGVPTMLIPFCGVKLRLSPNW